MTKQKTRTRRKSKYSLLVISIVVGSYTFHEIKSFFVGNALESALYRNSSTGPFLASVPPALVPVLTALAGGVVLTLLVYLIAGALRARFRPPVPHAQKIFRDGRPKRGEYWGYVYILANEAMPGILKIGYTSKNPYERAKELSSTGVATPFRVIHAEELEFAAKVERQIHRLLDDVRVNKNREFFRVDPQRAIKTIAAANRQVAQMARELS